MERCITRSRGGSGSGFRRAGQVTVYTPRAWDSLCSYIVREIEPAYDLGVAEIVERSDQHVWPSSPESPTERNPGAVRDRQFDPELAIELQCRTEPGATGGSPRSATEAVARPAAVGADSVLGQGRRHRLALHQCDGRDRRRETGVPRGIPSRSSLSSAGGRVLRVGKDAESEAAVPDRDGGWVTARVSRIIGGMEKPRGRRRGRADLHHADDGAERAMRPHPQSAAGLPGMREPASVAQEFSRGAT
jgi:hypothetical protein